MKVLSTSTHNAIYYKPFYFTIWSYYLTFFHYLFSNFLLFYKTKPVTSQVSLNSECFQMKKSNETVVTHVSGKNCNVLDNAIEQ